MISLIKIIDTNYLRKKEKKKLKITIKYWSKSNYLLTFNREKKKPLKLEASRYLSVFIRIKSKLTFICSYLQLDLEIYNNFVYNLWINKNQIIKCFYQQQQQQQKCIQHANGMAIGQRQSSSKLCTALPRIVTVAWACTFGYVQY